MKKMKKVAAAVLASSMILSLAACQGSGAKTETTAQGKTEETSGETG